MIVRCRSSHARRNVDSVGQHQAANQSDRRGAVTRWRTTDGSSKAHHQRLFYVFFIGWPWQPSERERTQNERERDEKQLGVLTSPWKPSLSTGSYSTRHDWTIQKVFITLENSLASSTWCAQNGETPLLYSGWWLRTEIFHRYSIITG